MCCLNYEQEAYEDLLRTSPKAESFVDTPDGRGTVTDVNLLRQSVHVRLEKQPDTVVCHKNCDICVLRNGKAKKNDEPIPDDLAPISGNPNKRKPAEQPSFTTYLEPVLIRGEMPPAPPAEEPVGEGGGAGKRRRRRGGKGKKPTDRAPQPAEQQPKEQKPREPKPQKPRGPKPTEPMAKRPDAAPAEGKSAEGKLAEGKSGEGKRNRRRYYQKRRKSKPDGQ